MTKPIRAAAVLWVVLAACSTRSASEVPTQQMWADISATSTDGANATVAATFRDGQLSLTFLQLTTDDHLTATQGSVSHPLVETSLLGLVTYNAAFSTGSVGTRFDITMTRKLDSGAPLTSVTLPEPVTLAAVSSPQSRANPFTVSWTSASSSDPLSVSVRGTCLQDFNASVPTNATSYTVTAGSLKKPSASSPDTCSATLTLSRTRNGTLDSHFLGGTAQGVQSRSVTFQTNP